MSALFTQIDAVLAAHFGPLGLPLAAGGLGVMIFVSALPIVLLKKRDPFDRLRGDPADRPGRDGTARHLGALRARLGKGSRLDRFAPFLEPQDQRQMSQARLRMLRAGYRSRHAVRLFHAAQFLLGMGMLLAGTAYAAVIPGGLDTLQSIAKHVLLPAAAGYWLPQYWVTRRIALRQEAIIAGFPDALDMLLVCVEAGQSLDQSMARVARELGATCPPLAQEFGIVSQEVRAGKDRVSVLRDMSERLGLADITSFTTTIIQSATFGTSIGDALRVYSAEMRDKRVMRAEEKANALPT
ncbi:MAG: hypothetical protein RIT14_2019, partial [Pseudomonadota bacterium]